MKQSTNKLKLIVILMIFLSSCAKSQGIQEKMGYSKDTKLVIIHADDLGVAHSENAASVKALEEGSVTSASIMVPCPWFTEIAEYARNNPGADLGLHLTLTSEWKNYKWGPVLGGNQVPSLVDESGYFLSGRDGIPDSMKAEEVGLELRAQIEKAIASGIRPTHLDAHMRIALSRADFAGEMLKLAREYKVPIASTPAVFKELLPDEDVSDVVFAENKLTVTPSDYEAGMKEFYIKTINALKPGLTEIVIHTAYDDAEMQAVTEGYELWGSAWRQTDFDFFTSDECKSLLEKNKVRVITWREVRDKLVR